MACKAAYVLDLELKYTDYSCIYSNFLSISLTVHIVHYSRILYPIQFNNEEKKKMMMLRFF